MKVLRFLLIATATAAMLALLLAGAALTPPLQTWFARMELLGQPGVQGSLGSISASFGRLSVEDLKLQSGGIVLTLPSLQARLPVLKAVWNRQVWVREIVAKGWTVDLSRLPDREDDISVPDTGASSGTDAPPERQAAFAFGGILAGRTLPFDASLDGVDLEGDVLLSVAAGKAPVRVHVTAKGGGMALGREGTFTIDATRVPDDPDSPASAASAHCVVVVSMDTPKTVDRVGIKADLSANSGSQNVDVTLAASAAKERGAADEAYTVDLTRGSRQLASLQARFPSPVHMLSGTWKLDLRDTDIAPFVPERPLPSIASSGSGQFDADGSFVSVHAKGSLLTVASHLASVAPALDRLGTLTVESRFDVTHSGRSLHVASAAASISGESPMAAVEALQPFEFDEATGEIEAGDSHQDFIDVKVERFPMGRLPSMPGGLAFSAGDAAGEFVVRPAEGGFEIRSKATLTARGVSIERSGRTVARNLDLAVPALAQIGAKQWLFQCSPVTVDSAGRHLATVDAKGSRANGANEPLAFSGSWTADLDALASLPAVPALSWITGRSASGDFTGSLGKSSELAGKFAVVGHDATHMVSATINADEDPGGAGELLAPVSVTFGSNKSDVSVEVSWAGEKSESRAEVKLTSESIALEQLRLLAAPLAAAGGVALPSRTSAGGARWAPENRRDDLPFWGDWVGRVTVSFDKLRTGDQDFTDVGGSFEVDHSSIQLEGGHGELPSKNMANMEGSILFDPASDHPYILKGSAAALTTIDSALLLPPQPGEDPVIQGHFSVAGSISGNGINLDDLMANTEEQFQLSGTNGIIRILKTDISDAIPEAKEPVSDSLGDAGNFVESVLGIKGHPINPAKNKVSKIADAVINFTNQVSEIGYDKVEVTATRGSDRTIHLPRLEMTSGDEHLTGSGQITYAKGLPISQEPLSVELQLGVDADLAKILSAAGLLSSRKDGLGYTLMSQPVRLGGTLLRIDTGPWHDILAKAATQKPPAEKKGAQSGAR